MNTLKKLKDYKQHQTNEEGFTLIELMIVVVIIGILAAIAIPIFANQQKEAMLASAKSDLRNAALSVTTYTAKNNGNIPTTCANVREMMATVSVSPGNEVRYLYSQTTPNVYFIRTHSLDKAFQNAAGNDVADEYRLFYLSEHGKTFYSKVDLGNYLTSQGTTIVAWLASHNFVSTTKTSDGVIGGCAVGAA